MEPHWGPRIDKIPMGGAIGTIIGIGLMIGFLGSVPETRLWLYISVPIGIVVAMLLRWRNRGRS